MKRWQYDPERIISDYRQAYAAANGEVCPFTVVYERGWFRFSGNGLSFVKRRVNVEKMTSRLMDRHWRALAYDELASSHKEE